MKLLSNLVAKPIVRIGAVVTFIVGAYLVLTS